ncbi:MAG TPA: RsmD family RNA methyltransferase [Solirubrobacteraceae bacterium]|nr:RsmD family RNA methyltransferase [Solirubrobacteraceae bacterium]
MIAGRYGGRRLTAPAGSATRPTSDRVREAVFSILAAVGGLDGVRVLDLFAGSGALGIEAVSRGAAHATFVEIDDAARTVLRANLTALGLGAGRPAGRDPAGAGVDGQPVAEPGVDGRPVAEPVVRIRGGDALTALRSVETDGEHFDLVFVDPPYADAAELGRRLGPGLERVVADGGWVVCESDRRSPIELDLRLERERRYGDTLIRIYRRGDRSR